MRLGNSAYLADAVSGHGVDMILRALNVLHAQHPSIDDAQRVELPVDHPKRLDGRIQRATHNDLVAAHGLVWLQHTCRGRALVFL